MEIPQQILDLIEKYLSSSITKDELTRLNAWYHEFDDSRAEMDMEALPAELKDQIGSEEQLAHTIYSRLMNSDALKQPDRKVATWKKLAAAITLLICLTGAGYFFLGRHQSSDTSVAANMNQAGEMAGDLAPGGNKARLTLADGSVIILDSAGNGIIGSQAGTNIAKTGSGQLVYSGKNTPTAAPVLMNEMTTPRGGTYQITLADGTKVWLNAATRLSFPTAFPGGTREVQLEGEAYFEVAKKPAQPFIVHTKDQTVRVLGTHFNVNAYPDEPSSKTTLLEGKVQVSSIQASDAIVTLKPGEQATLQRTGKIKVNLHPDLEQATGWKDGEFVFHSTDLKTILRLLSRWYDADIDYQGTSNPVFTGQISKQLPVSKVFGLLSLTNEVHYAVVGNKIKVSSK